MHCNDFIDRFFAGEALPGALEDHRAGCPACRDASAFVDPLRAAPPRPSAALRSRVLASFPRRGWRPSPAWAAALLLAAAAGFIAGSQKKPVEVAVERFVDKPADTAFTQDQILLLTLSLQRHYQGGVDVDFEDNICQKIKIDPGVFETCDCPTIREARRLAKARPDLIVMR